jgi:hypothetical protein
MHYIITFQSTHHVLKAEKILLAAGVTFEIIPTPKNISSECGISIRFFHENHHRHTVEKMLKDKEMQYKIYEIRNKSR